VGEEASGAPDGSEVGSRKEALEMPDEKKAEWCNDYLFYSSFRRSAAKVEHVLTGKDVGWRGYKVKA
jgi:hypothetical protein